MKTDYVYYFKDLDGSDELKYSMRSVEKNMGDFGRFILMGDIPDWYKESDKVVAIKLDQKYMPRSEITWWYLRKLSELDVIKDYKFVLMNDDFMCMKSQPEAPQHFRAEEDYVKYAEVNRFYHQRTKRALSMLKMIGVDTQMKFNLHIPMPLKTNIVELCLFYQDKYHFSDLDFRTFYGNLENKLNPIEGLYAINDVKSRLIFLPEEEAFDSTYLSTNAVTFRKYRETFEKLFPLHSIAEK